MNTTSLFRRMAALVGAALLGALPAAAQSPAGQPGPTPMAPIYARYIGVDKLWGGTYKLDGKGDTVGLFEFQNYPQLLHPELQHMVSRAFAPTMPAEQKPDVHPTQVMGVLTGKGVNAMRKGCVNQSTIDMYATDGSPAQFIQQAGKRNWQISNHSYGINRGWVQTRLPSKALVWVWNGTLDGSPNTKDREDPHFGHYDKFARQMDSVMYARPTQIPVVAAGNQRGIAPAGDTAYAFILAGTEFSSNTGDMPHPANGGAGGWDVLASIGLAKNAIVVGAVDSTNKLWAHSNTGPTDDGRIKPDVVALGVDVPLSGKVGNLLSYTTASGTSYAAPAVSGALLQLREYWRKFNPTAPFTAATARGLLIHTARDIDNIGPDYRTGWGKVDAQAAADLIQLNSTNNGFSIRQATLKQGESYEFYIKSYTNGPVRGTIAWNDPPGIVMTGPSGRITLNNRTPTLINDLDIRMYEVLNNGKTALNKVYHPFTLDPTKPAEEANYADNVVDNVEQIYFKAVNTYLPGQFSFVYKVVIKHKGTLSGGKQDFALFMSGASEVLLAPQEVKVATNGIAPKGGASLAATSAFVTWNAAPGATNYDVQYRTIGSQQWTAINNVSKTEAKLDNLQAATYQVQVRARHGAVVSPWTSVVQFYGSTPVKPSEVWITQQTTTSGVVNWTAVNGATQYEVQWARIAGDNTVLGGWKKKVVNGTSTTLSSLYPDQYYAVYVRTKYANNLLSDYSDVQAFWTLSDCSSYEPNNTPPNARKIRTGDYADGMLCKGDKEDWFLIYNPSGFKNLQVTFYEHSKPFKLTIYRQPINGGTVSAVPNTTITNNGTQSVKVNNADFANYNYYVQVWVNDPNVTYSDSEPFTIIATTKATPYQANGDAVPTPMAKPSIEESREAAAGAIQLYPNPANSSTTIGFRGVPSGSNVRLVVYDARGRVAYSIDGIVSPNNSIVLPTEGLPTGAYMVEAIADNKRLTKRLMVVR
ncbi:MAG: S8 family serine peptidase [Armatimonadetes bacterium]|nr:S8 family serine peptidase [Armatimonadota bacterium]